VRRFNLSACYKASKNSTAPPPPRQTQQLRSQHRDNVLALLHASLLRGHYDAAAGAAAALLAAETVAVDARELLGAGPKRAAQRKAEVVWAALELLRRHGTSNEQVRGWSGWRVGWLGGPLLLNRGWLEGELMRQGY